MSEQVWQVPCLSRGCQPQCHLLSNHTGTRRGPGSCMDSLVFRVMRIGRDQRPKLARVVNLFNEKSQILTHMQNILNLRHRSLIKAIYGLMHVSRAQSTGHQLALSGPVNLHY